MADKGSSCEPPTMTRTLAATQCLHGWLMLEWCVRVYAWLHWLWW